MTATILIAAVGAGGVLLARLARSCAPLLLIYLALRRTPPRQRAEILQALAPAVRGLTLTPMRDRATLRSAANLR
jgi:hypothetical protein